MRQLRCLWKTFDRLPGLAAIPAFWREHCGPDYAAIAPFLRPTGRAGYTYPCPNPIGEGCPRRIVHYANGDIVAKCEDPWQECGDVQLTREQTLAHELDVSAFTRAIAYAIGVRWQPPVKVRPGAWSIGLSGRRDSRDWPVYFLVSFDGQKFCFAIDELLLAVSGPFLVLAPTDRYYSVDMQQRLNARGVQFLALEDRVSVNEEGAFVASDPVAVSSDTSPTPVADRQKLLENFRTKYDCTVQKTADEAEVHIRDLYKWVRGEIKDSSKKSKRLEDVMRRGLTGGAKALAGC